jgi:hypothetical protein
MGFPNTPFPTGRGLVTGPNDYFAPITFLGATVIGFSANAGLNDQESSCNIQLVEDKTVGQNFTPLEPGTPIVFSAGSSFSFHGLYQYGTKSVSTQGSGIWTILLTGPREVLDGTAFIIDGYNGSVAGIPNVVNGYGILENSLGFGGSLTNAAGMPWNYAVGLLPSSVQAALTVSGVSYVGVQSALEAVVNNLAGGGTYGNGMYLNGNRFVLNLSGITSDLNVPAYYRLPGPSISVLEIINSLYRDAGHDYIAKMIVNSGSPTQIYFKSIDRTVQPSMTQIRDFINSRNDVISSDYGYELRSDTTAVLLVGAQQESLTLINNNGSNILPYFGSDSNGNPITTSGVGDYTVNLNATSIPNVMGFLGGGLTYSASQTELRLAMESYDAWAAYVKINNPSIATPLGITSAASADGSPLSTFISDFINDDPLDADIIGSGLYSELVNMGGQLYDLVKNAATEHYGRKFAVKLPFISSLATESNSNNVKYSIQPSDSAYLPEGSSPLGLSYLNELQFLDQDLKLTPFASFKTSLGGADPTTVNVNSSVLQYDTLAGNSLYTGVSIDPNIVKLGDGSQAVIVTLDQPLLQLPDSALGNIGDIANLFSTDIPTISGALDYYSDNFPLRISPSAIVFDSVAVPLRSNISVYGPWATGNLANKTQFIRDESLNPWNYGSFTAMNAAALAKIQNAATNITKVETGSVTVAGLPGFSLGDQLVAAGSEITGIDLQFGVGGIQTTYRLQTYTPRKGRFSQARATQIQEFGLGLAHFRRQMRQVQQRNNTMKTFNANYQAGQQLNRVTSQILQQSPHGMLVSHAVPYGSGYVNLASVQKTKDVLGNLRTNKSGIYQTTSACSMDSVFRGFSTASGASGIPHYQKVDGRVSNAITLTSLNHFQSGSDIQWLTFNPEYSGLNSRKRSINFDDARPVGIRLPQVGVGYGYTIFGNPVPGTGSLYSASGGLIPANSGSRNFLANYRQRQDQWIAAPIEQFYDPFRCVWGAKGLYSAFVGSGSIAPNSSGNVFLTINGTKSGDALSVFNWLGSTLATGVKCYIGWFPLDNRFQVISADC